MARYSYPSIRMTEIDNSVRNVSTPTVGVGAIVMKANRGPVNERITTHNYSEFKEYFGAPETDSDYGHFAAENFFANSRNLVAVRATMGDESYAQIQFPYQDATAEDTNRSKDTASFQFINNEDTNKLELLEDLNPVVQLDQLADWEQLPAQDGKVYAAFASAGLVTVKDLISDTAPGVLVYKKDQSIVDDEGQYVEFVKNVGKDGSVVSKEDDLIFTSGAWANGTVASGNFAYGQTITYYDEHGNPQVGTQVKFTVPAADTLNKKNLAVSFYASSAANFTSAEEIKYSDIFKDANFFKKEGETAEYVTDFAATKIKAKDWDDCETKTHYIATSAMETTSGDAVGISFREYGFADKTEALVMGDLNAEYRVEYAAADDFYKIEENKVLAQTIAESYGLEVDDLLAHDDNGKIKYGILSYVDVREGVDPEDTAASIDDYYKGKRTYKIVFADFDPNDPNYKNEKLFWLFSVKNKHKAQTVSVYTIGGDPQAAVLPWQESDLARLGAHATSEILNAVSGKYKDGYTRAIESDNEPGNGDIEQYQPNHENQLVIAAIGPGKFGNDIGVSIITAEADKIPALHHPNAFNWKYKYDTDDALLNGNEDDLTWKKVYRINVYTKLKTQTAQAAWGTGVDALLKDPDEFWLVSNDPTAKDGEGKSLYAPNVINGNSKYIYVSRNSVNSAVTGSGTFAQPQQTFAIYGLTGGENSKKNTAAEKTAALKLLEDRQKAPYNIIFNVEAIPTFNGRERYAAMQQRIAQIAGNRTMDLGIVQTTSLEAHDIKTMKSEGKNFAFNNGSYVWPTANYDKYYNSDLAQYIYLPKSVACACAVARNQILGTPWKAPAGTKYGAIAYSVNQLVNLSDDEIGQLLDYNITTSRLCGLHGECIWGHKTALRQESKRNRVNVRECLNFIELALKNYLDPFLFEQNIPTIRGSIKNIIDAFLSRVAAGGGIDPDFRTSVVADPNDDHIVLVNIALIPTDVIEFIDVRITINRGTFTIEDNLA